MFDVEHGGYALYPGIWAGADLALPERGASDFLNASWARVFLPIRAGFETQALEFILAGGAARLSPQQRQTIKTLVDELNKFRNDHFGDPTGIAIDPQTHKVTDSFDLLAEWNETTPTDGTHAEAVLATTTALDEASEQLLSDEADLRKASIRERVDDAALKEKAEKMMTAPSTGVTITANGQ